MLLSHFTLSGSLMYFSLDQFLQCVVKGPRQKKPALGIFQPLVSCLLLSANERPVFSLWTNQRPVQRVACPDSPRVGNTLECLDRDNQFQPQPVSLSTAEAGAKICSPRHSDKICRGNILKRKNRKIFRIC